MLRPRRLLPQHARLEGQPLAQGEVAAARDKAAQRIAAIHERSAALEGTVRRGAPADVADAVLLDPGGVVSQAYFQHAAPRRRASHDVASRADVAWRADADASNAALAPSAHARANSACERASGSRGYQSNVNGTIDDATWLRKHRLNGHAHAAALDALGPVSGRLVGSLAAGPSGEGGMTGEAPEWPGERSGRIRGVRADVPGGARALEAFSVRAVFDADDGPARPLGDSE